MGERMNIYQKFTVVIMDLLILVELGICMYFGMAGDPEDLTMFFLKNYLPLLLATILAGRLVIHRLGMETGKTALQE